MGSGPYFAAAASAIAVILLLWGHAPKTSKEENGGRNELTHTAYAKPELLTRTT